MGDAGQTIAMRSPADLSEAERRELYGLHAALVDAWLRGRIGSEELRRRWHSHAAWEIGPDGAPRPTAAAALRQRLAAVARSAAPPAPEKPCREAGVPERFDRAVAAAEADGPEALRTLAREYVALFARATHWTPCQRAARQRHFLALWEGRQQPAAAPQAAPAAPPAASAPVPPPAASVAIRSRCDPAATHAYIVGKGPSLDRLTAADFPDRAAPILACNEAIHAVERLDLPNPAFCIQQDAALGTRCRPQHATWLLSRQAWADGQGDTYDPAVRYTPKEVGGRSKSLTANMAIRYLALAGFRTATMLAFDACTCRDIAYAPSIGETPSARRNNDGSRFLGYCHEYRKVARQAKLAIDFREPVDTWTVACVLRSGGAYNPAHVDWLRRQVEARVKTPHRVACLTDVPGLAGAVPLRHGWPGWWSKVELFRPGVFAPGTPVLYLDLDVVLCADIVLPDPGSLPAAGLLAPADWWRAGERNSSVMLWRAGEADAVYTAFLVDPAAAMAETPHGDQAWISAHVETADPPLRIRSWKAHRLAEQGAGDAQVAVFHGRPKPWQVTCPWVPAFCDPAAAPSGRARWLAGMLRERDAAVYVEVGVKEGRTLAWIARACPECRVYGVDLFRPQPGTAGPEDYARWDWPKILSEYIRGTQPYGSRVTTIMADVSDAAACVPEPADLVFLDAYHGAEATLRAIRAWLPRVRPGGILAGNDYDWATVREAVAKALPSGVSEADDHVWWVAVDSPLAGPTAPCEPTHEGATVTAQEVGQP